MKSDKNTQTRRMAKKTESKRPHRDKYADKRERPDRADLEALAQHWNRGKR